MLTPPEQNESVLIQERYTRDGLHIFSCHRCRATMELPFSFSWMVIDFSMLSAFPLPAVCPVRFCWSCGRPFIYGKRHDA